MVDHKILDLFPEAVVSIADPIFSFDFRHTLISMLSVNDNWNVIVESLMNKASRIIMLMDSPTPGVRKELDLLVKLNVNKKTLIVSGQHFRTSGERLPKEVLSDFTHIVDWIDFSYDENYHDSRYKAHRVVQSQIKRFVQSDSRPVVNAWLKQ